MKKYFPKAAPFNTASLLTLAMLLLWAGTTIMITGCKKNRLFAEGDSIDVQRSQFHFFNGFSYDSALAFSVDGLFREQVKMYTLSDYYPSSNSFSLNNGQPNSKLISVNDPQIKTQHANRPDNSIFQFRPNTSYIIFPVFPAYDTANAPMRNVVPTIQYYPEDIYHPFNGTTGVRMFSMVAGGSPTLSITPDKGQGTSLLLRPVATATQPVRASDSYTTTQKGLKKLMLDISSSSGGPAISITFIPFELEDGKNYSFFAAGDAKNFLNNIQPMPKLFVMEDGVPASLKELTMASISYGGISRNIAGITIVNGAYNVPGFVSGVKDYVGVGTRFNEYTVSVMRWPLASFGGEDVNLANTFYTGGVPGMQQRVSSTAISAGPYLVTMTPFGAYSPVYDQYSQNFEGGLNYTLCLLPDHTSARKMGRLLLENGSTPDPKLFKLRIVNIMGGSAPVDIHTGSPSGPVIASSVGYAEPTEYVSFQPSSITQDLYVTAAGSTLPLFQTGAYDKPIQLAFRGGNSGTLYLMGLLPGQPYAGDAGYFKPYVYYRNEAFTNSLFAIQSAQLYYQL